MSIDVLGYYIDSLVDTRYDLAPLRSQVNTRTIPDFCRLYRCIDLSMGSAHYYGCCWTSWLTALLFVVFAQGSLSVDAGKSVQHGSYFSTQNEVTFSLSGR